jgi:hypothetical protein
VDDQAIAALNTCKYLFLAAIEELDNNGLRIVVREGVPAGPAEPLLIAGTAITGGIRISVTEESAAFELVWQRYVAYGVINESFGAPDDEAIYTGNRFRLYSKSHFIDYLSRASFACEEYPGPTRHIAVLCENHIIDVIATMMPTVRQFA